MALPSDDTSHDKRRRNINSYSNYSSEAYDEVDECYRCSFGQQQLKEQEARVAIDAMLEMA